MGRKCLWDLTIRVDEKKMFMRSHHNSRWEDKFLWELTVTVDEKRMFMRSHRDSRW